MTTHLAGLLVGVLLSTTVAQGAWVVTEYETIDGSTRQMVMSETAIGGYAQWAFRCSPEAELGIDTVIAPGAGVPAGDRYVVTIEYDVREPLIDYWEPLADHAGVGIADYRVDVILTPVLYLGATSAGVTIEAGGGSVSLQFDLSGLRAALDELECYT